VNRCIAEPDWFRFEIDEASGEPAPLIEKAKTLQKAAPDPIPGQPVADATEAQNSPGFDRLAQAASMLWNGHSEGKDYP
jgi:hypothetical protein